MFELYNPVLYIPRTSKKRCYVRIRYKLQQKRVASHNGMLQLLLAMHLYWTLRGFYLPCYILFSASDYSIWGGRRLCTLNIIFVYSVNYVKLFVLINYGKCSQHINSESIIIGLSKPYGTSSELDWNKKKR